MIESIILVELLSTAYLTGLIWFVQVVHYPLFAAVGVDRFCDYEKRHVRLTSLVVGPPMLIEAASAIALGFMQIHQQIRMLNLVGIGLLIVIWLSTWSLQVPCHRLLECNHSDTVIGKLVKTNWLRTIAWTIRMLLIAAMVLMQMRQLAVVESM